MQGGNRHEQGQAKAKAKQIAFTMMEGGKANLKTKRGHERTYLLGMVPFFWGGILWA